jgi:hypothetical protein
MAKRFIDTGLFDDEWFSSLTSDGKIGWMYCITKCDHAGIIDFNEKLFTFQTGVNSLATVIKELGNRLVRVNDQKKYFIPKFIDFQYPKFPQSSVKQQDSAIKILKSLGLWSEETNSYLTVRQELPNPYVTGNGNVSVNGSTKPILHRDRFLQDTLAQQQAYKFVKGIGKPLTIEKIIELSEAHDAQFSLSHKGGDYTKWCQYLCYFLEGRKPQQDKKRQGLTR